MISIIIPAYKAAGVIQRAIDAVLAQTLDEFEILVVNDGSPDTAELEQALQKYGDKVIYLKQENLGAAAARNLGLKAARGEFIAFLDADDYWTKDYLASQMQVLSSPGVDVVYCNALFVGEPRLKGKTYMQLAPSKREVTPESLLSVDVGVITSGVLARKKAIFDVGLFDETIPRGHDFDLWLRLAQKGYKFKCHPKVLVNYSVSNTGLSGNVINQVRRRIELLNTIKARGNLTESEKLALEDNLSSSMVRLAVENGKAKLASGNFQAALSYFNEANSISRSWKLILVRWCLRIAPALFCKIYRSRFA